MDRREFLSGMAKTAAAIGLAAGMPELTADTTGGGKMAGKAELKKALILNMVPGKTTGDKFKLLADLGFQGVEVHPTADPREIDTLRRASERYGVRIHSIIYGGWDAPLSSADPATADRGVAGVKSALQCAKSLGADAVLLVPAVVNADTPYKDAYERSQKRIRSLILIAQNLGVTITVENVWNNFLLSPLEFARYVDELKSPCVQAYFDIGNVVGAFGFPQDWIRTLDKRIRKLHLKDFKLDGRQWVNLRDGDVNWPEVRKALDEIRYKGFMTAELPGGDETYLRDLSARMEKIVAGE